MNNIPYIPAQTKVEDINAHAKTALNLQASIKTLTDSLNVEKEFFRDLAGGEAFSVTIPGKGEVRVNKPSAPSVVETITFNLERFKQLQPIVQQSLIDTGVVVVSSVSKPAGTAAVVISNNK